MFQKIVCDGVMQKNLKKMFAVLFFLWGSEIMFSMFGNVMVSLFCLYLFSAVMKGNFKFGMRFFIIELHPMKVGETYMNSFLVNISLMLLCTPALVMFVAQSLKEYLSLTDADTIFGQQVRFMRFFRVFFDNNVFIIITLAVFVISAIYFIKYPNDNVVKTSRLLKARIKKFRAIAEKEAAEAANDDEGDVELADKKNFGAMAVV